MSGAGWIADQIKAVRAETRFVPRDDRHLPVGARELTERELAVLRLLPHGLPRRELAAQLFLSENTVKTHIKSIRRKLGLGGRDDIVARARDLGLLPQG
jgi:LuxR family maltose regulon positive regulatory protein